MRIPLVTIGDVPYLRVGAQACAGVRDDCAVSTGSAGTDDADIHADACPVVQDAGGDGAAIPAADNGVLMIDDGRRDLKSEALSIAHLMTHKPKNRWCMACQKAKMQHRHRRSKGGVLDADIKKFGDSITADHLIAQNDLSRGITGDRDALVIKDRAAGWIACYPVPDKGADEAYAKILNFLGTQKCRYL